MGFLEGFIYTIWRGLAIGVIISAPMGPVGILCVQRTLDKGRRAGFYTGIGAALSDILYCLLTGFGLSFIEEFLERNSNVIQLIGSVVLIGFGIYLFRSNPSRKLKKPVDQKITAGKNILNGFLFTFSNPLIIFLIIGLFARFNFAVPELRIYHYIIGFIAIFAGALLWWYMVTFFVDKVRAHFNLRSMWLINKIIGGIIFIFAVVGIITAVSGIASASEPKAFMNKQRGFTRFRHATDSALIIRNTGSSTVKDLIAVDSYIDNDWRMRIANVNGNRGGTHTYLLPDGKRIKTRYPGWGIMLKGGDEETIVKLHTIDDSTDETYSSPCIMLTVESGGKEISKKALYSGFDLYDGFNSFRLNISERDWKLYGGDRSYSEIALGNMGAPIDSIGFIVMPGGEINVQNISHRASGSIDRSELADEDYEALTNSSDDMEGTWGIFDMTLDETLLKIGGNYTLAIRKSSGTDNYDVIYLSGAITNSESWEPGSIKGHLYSTPFDSVYDMEWIGASGNKIGSIKVQKEGEMLVLQFPDFGSQIRLRKITTHPKRLLRR